jgi:3-mercaptopyruvate sulfurtransferase SseA
MWRSSSLTCDAADGFRRDLHRWRQLVTPAWLQALVAQQPVIACPAGDWRLLEIGFGDHAVFLQGHIPGAGYIDTTALEQGPLWNKVADEALLALLLKHGIGADTTVVLYSRKLLPAARAAHLMLYAGVGDVRLLDGGLSAWNAQGLPLAQGLPRAPDAAKDFGAVFPGRPAYMADMHQIRRHVAAADACLVSIRTWNEFIGRTSGYSYIPERGDIPGSVWGRTGGDDDVNSISEFHDQDGRMRTAADIRSIWLGKGIHGEQQTVFYCGTGWRASLAFFYAWLMDWPRICVYDGGWAEWSDDAANPVICRESAACEAFMHALDAPSRNHAFLKGDGAESPL